MAEMTHSTAANAPSRNHGLDLLRGLCAVGVAGYHFTSWNFGVAIESIGAFGVYTFFVLSATTLMVVYAHKFETNITRQNATAFYRNRFARIMPLLALISIITFIWLLSRGAPVWINLQKTILTGTGLFAFGTSALLSGVTGAWSLGIEIVFYFTFPLIALFSAKASIRACVFVVGGSLIAQHLAMSLLWGFDILNLWYNYVTPLVFAPYFAMGILIYRLPSEKKPVFLAIGLGAIGIVFLFSIFSSADLYRSALPHLVLTILVGVATWGAYRSELPSFLLPVAAFLGDISYALYLTHFLANSIAGRLFEGAGVKPLRTIAFIVLALVLSAATYRYFERPARQRLRGN